MIRRSTVVYITILLLLFGAYFYLKDRVQPAEDILITPEAGEPISYLFSADEGVPTSIRIESGAGETVQIARDAENAWTLTLPFEARAEQGSAEAAASQVTTMRVLDRIPDLDADIAGLNDPQYSLTVKFNDSVERTVDIGVVTPSESGYYARDESGGDVMIISRSSVEALLSLLDTPPYLETPTPSPTATDDTSPNGTVTPTP